MVLGLALASAACTSGEGALQDTESAETSVPVGADEDAEGRAADGGAPDEPPFEPSIGNEELSGRLTELGGKLAIGNGPELSVARPDGTGRVQLDGSEEQTAAQPTWTGDGTRLAWSSLSAERQVVLVESFDDEGMPTGRPENSDASGFPVFYLQWAAGGDRLAYIRNSTTAGRVEVGTAEPGRAVEARGVGAPFFVSWSPDGGRLAGHVDDETVQVHDAAAAQPGFDVVGDGFGGFTAPAWVDDRRLLTATGSALALFDPETGSAQTLVDLEGPVRFVLSPDRTKVAYQVLGGGGISAASLTSTTPPADGGDGTGAEEPDPFGLTVLDLESGDRTVLTVAPAASWEWSPDSDKLAWLTFSGAAATVEGRWRFHSLSGAPLGTDATVGFGPTRKVLQNYLPFFAQYAQSSSRWSPDSTAFAFAGSIGADRGIWIQLVDERVRPVRVYDGDYVNWGDGPPLPAVGDRASAA